jgi:UDP-N-acetylglucosamine acyltransferase
LNTIGLRRAGIGPTDRLELKRLYQKLFRSNMNLSEAMAEAQQEFVSDPARHLLEFIAASKRGVCRHRSVAKGEDDTDDADID